ncbi:low-density lipoprotein receptor-related protein 2-like, partial [Saccostrea cucullata]|uniref:low-density lipoprotein receptor-related protein 2-like n=1 Tax=Saccostrea cuccullata TaxID=36930 RepID=UPI002ED0B846
MKSLWIFYLGIIPLCIVKCEYRTYYLNEHCGRTLHVESFIRLQASKDNHLRPDLTCLVYLSATPGDSSRIHTRFRSIDLSIRTSKCERSRIELYEGTRNANPLTPINGLCGDFLYKTYSYFTVNESIMTFNLTTGPSTKEGSFDAIVTNFHKVEEDEKCLYKWWKCRNGRCVHPSTRCNSFDNCGDNSDETYETCDTTMYFYENCGQEIHVYDSLYLKLKSNDGYLIPDVLCDNIVVAHGKFPDLGEVVSVYAHFRSISLSQPEDGVCMSSRIDIYSGLKEKKNLTGSEGLCGNSLAIADYSTTDDNFMPIEFKTDIITQRGNFEIILTSFHTPTSGDCLSGEFRCDNGWCVDSTVKCDGFQNCVD